jgi:RNA polymerase sigma-70 factor, ECF subfamily
MTFRLPPYLYRQEVETMERAPPGQRALLERYVAAFEASDVDALAAVLTEDASWQMPPIPVWFEGRDQIARFLAGRMRATGGLRAIPTAANGQPAYGLYARHEDGMYRPHAIHVLALTDGGVCGVVSFSDPALFSLFGLPPIA